MLGLVVPNAGIPFESVGSGNTVTYQIQYADESAVSDPTLAGISSFDSGAFDVDANGWVTLLGGGVAATNIDVDASTAPGTDPVVPNGAGNITITGGQVAAGTIGANVIRTNSLAANALTVEIQRSSNSAAPNNTLNGVSHFNSTEFTVDGTGFVSLIGGTMAIDSIGVQTGTNPIVPDGAGLVTINGAVVAAGTNPVRTDGTGANTMAVEVQISQALAATDATKIGLSNFDSGDFSVDANGFVTLNGAGAGQTITGDTGGALSPTAGNWDILGQQAGIIPVMITTGSGSTLNVEDRTWVTPYVVDASATVGLRGTYTTIQAAITAASSGQIVYVRPGTYTEDLTLKAGVNLVGFDSGFSTSSSVNIVGNATLASGTVIIENICLRTNAAAVATVSAGTLNIINSFILATNGDPFVSTGGNINLIQCNVADTANGKIFTCSSTASVLVENCVIISADVTPSTFTNSSGLTVRNSTFQPSISTSDTVQLKFYNSNFGSTSLNSTLITTAGTGVANEAYDCVFDSGNAVTFSIGAGTLFNISNCVVRSSNTNPISGAGTVHYSGITFPSTTSTINTTTQVPYVSSNDAVKVVTPGAYPYTTVPQDAVILVDTSSARTIVPLASPTTGQKHIIKDITGSAAANNITVTPSGKNIDGAASSTMNINYGALTIVYTGSEWSVV